MRRTSMLNRFRLHEGWTAFILLFLLLLTTTISLQAAKWAPGMEMLSGVMFGALFVGYLSAKSRLSGLLLHPLALLLGTLWILLLSLGQVADAAWESQLAEVIVRVVIWAREVSNGIPNGDTLPFTLTMGALVWLLVYGATWDFFRAHHIWGVLLPSGITILVNTYYARESLTLLLLIFLGLAFLLVIRTTLYERELQWQRRDVAYSADIQFDFMREGALFALAVIAIAWLLPATIDSAQVNPALTRLSQPWGRAQQEWGRMFSALNYRGTGSGTWFGSSMNFHGPLTRSNTLVMHVRAPRGRYWRAVVLDKYTSAGWIVSDNKMLEGPEENEPLPGTDSAIPGRERITQEYTIYTPAGTQLFAAGQPQAVSLDTRLLINGATGQAPSFPSDGVAQIFARTPLFQGQSYSAISAVPQVDVLSLREAGSEYPAWIEAPYTQVPDTVPARVGELAEELTQGLTTPYDKARALETYLRAIPYNELIPGPRPGEDGVDYFLFRERQGYCDYYASSMAIMLRTLGIPARLAQGYNQGTLQENGVYEVRQINAHSWVEVYFPGYGWIEFEPTAAEPALDRPAAPPDYDYEDDALAADDFASTSLDINDQLQEEMADLRDGTEGGVAELQPAGFVIDSRLLVLPLGLLGIVALLGVTGWALAQQRWRGLDQVERFFDQLGLFGRALGERSDPTLTPHEYADRVGEQVPPARPPLRRLADLFAKRRFSQRPLEAEEEQEVSGTWKQARRTLLRGIARRFTPRPPRRRD